MNSDDQKSELEYFQSIWRGGYFSGSPHDVLYSKYGIFGYVGTYHLIYLCCIKPYVHATTTSLEIGCGRGAWTKALLPSKRVWCLDALSAEHNEFWEYVGKQDHVNYVQVEDYSCSMIPDNSIDYLFSYDSLCHVSFQGLAEYMENLWPKLTDGARGFIMVADFDKYNTFWRQRSQYDVLQRLRNHAPGSALSRVFIRRCLSAISRVFDRRTDHTPLVISDSDEPNQLRWWHAGTGRTADMLRDLGYEIVQEDVGVDPRSPVLHFQKPARQV